MSCLINLSQKTISAVKVIQVAWLKNHPRCCPICYDSLEKSKGLVDTPCGHQFCLLCYVRLEEPSCPMCRADTHLAEPKLPAGAVLFDHAKALRTARRHTEEQAYLRGQIHALESHIDTQHKTMHALELRIDTQQKTIKHLVDMSLARKTERCSDNQIYQKYFITK